MNTAHRFVGLSLVTLAALSIVLVLSLNINLAHAEEHAPTLTTDQADYAPGSLVTIFGNFFESLQNLSLTIVGQAEDGSTAVNDTWNVSASDLGSFTTTYQLPNFYVPLYLLAANSTTGELLAETTFTDKVNVGYSKAVYNKGSTAPNDATGVWTTGNAGSNYLENQWAYYQYQIQGVGDNPVPSFDISFNHYQSSSGALFVDSFANFRACLDCTQDSHASGPMKGMINDGVPYPSDLTTNWKDASSAITLVNHPFSSTCQGGEDVVNTPSGDHCFHVDGAALAALFSIPASGDHTITLFYAAHLAASSVWTTGNESLLGCTSDPAYVNPYPSTMPNTLAYGTDAYSGGDPCVKGDDAGDWTTPFFGVGSATGSSRHFEITNQTAGSNGGLTLPIPTVPPANASITLDKVTSPSGNSTSFSFSTTGLPVPTSPSLTDATAPITWSGLSAGSYTITETQVPGWSLTSKNCTGGNQSSVSQIADGISINLAAGENLTCTFTNTLQQGHIIVDKVTVPGNSQQSFSFTTTGTGYNGFSLTDQASPND